MLAILFQRFTYAQSSIDRIAMAGQACRHGLDCSYFLFKPPAPAYAGSPERRAPPQRFDPVHDPGDLPGDQGRLSPQPRSGVPPMMWVLGALTLVIGIPVAGLLWMTSVPGRSHVGPLHPLTPDQAHLASRLQDHVRAIASKPHNVAYPQELERAHGTSRTRSHRSATRCADSPSEPVGRRFATSKLS